MNHTIESAPLQQTIGRNARLGQTQGHGRSLLRTLHSLCPYNVTMKYELYWTIFYSTNRTPTWVSDWLINKYTVSTGEFALLYPVSVYTLQPFLIFSLDKSYCNSTSWERTMFVKSYFFLLHINKTIILSFRELNSIDRYIVLYMQEIRVRTSVRQLTYLS
jgi:hypothetical protein